MRTRKLAAGVLSLGIAGLPTMTAGAHPATSHQPTTACKSFTSRGLDKLYGIAKTEHLKRQASQGSNYTACLVKHRQVFFGVNISTNRPTTQEPEPTTVYHRPKLGHHGEIIVSKPGDSAPHSSARYKSHGYWTVDNIDMRFGHKGHRMYVFALAQSKRFKA